MCFALHFLPALLVGFLVPGHWYASLLVAWGTLLFAAAAIMSSVAVEAEWRVGRELAGAAADRSFWPTVSAGAELLLMLTWPPAVCGEPAAGTPGRPFAADSASRRKRGRRGFQGLEPAAKEFLRRLGGDRRARLVKLWQRHAASYRWYRQLEVKSW